MYSGDKYRDNLFEGSLNLNNGKCVHFSNDLHMANS